MKRVRYILILAICTSCSWWEGKPNKTEYTSIDGFCQGTTYTIVYNDTTDFKLQIEQILRDFDASLSIFNDQSRLCKLNDNRTSEVDSLFQRCFELSVQMNRLSKGFFDPTFAPVIEAYGFGAKGKATKVTSERLKELMTLTGIEKLSIQDNKLTKQNPKMSLNFNAIAQGMSVDLISDFLRDSGVSDFMVEVGGEIYCEGLSPSGRLWRIGVDKPTQGNFISGGELSAIIELTGKGLATSGNYRKFIQDSTKEMITHTIDPRTGMPARHNLLSATIIAVDAATADAIATACMVGGLEWSRVFIEEHSDSVAGLLIYANSKGEFEHYATLPIIDIPNQ